MKKVVIVGAGSMAREHIRAFSGLEDASVVGIYSRTQAKAENLAEEFSIPLVAESLESLYAQTNPDLVVVGVSILAAKDVLKACINMGVPILTEKPIALDFIESKAVQDYAHEKGCKVWVGLNRRCYSSTQSALTDLATKDEPRIIQIWDQQELEVANRLGHPRAVQDNWMYANSIHLVDYLCVFGRGEVTDVTVTNPFDAKAPGLVHAVVHFSSGDVGLYTAIWDGPGPWGCIVTTPSVRWEMTPLEGASFVRRGTRKAIAVEIDERDTQYKAGFCCQAKEIIAALDGALSTSACDIDAAMVTTDLVQSIYFSL